MSAICGILHLDDRSVAENDLRIMNNRLAHRGGDSDAMWHDGPVGFGHHMRHVLPENTTERLPFSDPETGVTVTADVRLDNRDELNRLLRLSPGEALTVPDSQYILHAYLKWGSDCLAHLYGDFAFAIWDPRERRLFCARDQVGVRLLHYYFDGRRFLFATEIKAILTQPNVPQRVNENMLANFLLSNCQNATDTFYEQIYRLEAAHYLLVSPAGLKKGRYWDLNPDARLPHQKDEDYIEGFRERLFAAVETRLRSSSPVGAEVSGGLDSTTIAAVAARQLRARNSELRTFSHVLPPDGAEDSVGDEREQIEQLRQHAGFKHHSYISGSETSFMEKLARFTEVYDGLPPLAFGIVSDDLNHLAQKQGVRVLLSGLGGDQMVSSFCRGFHLEMLKTGRWSLLLRELKLHAKKRQDSLLASLLQHAILPAFPGLRQGFWHFKMPPGFQITLKDFCINPKFAQRMGVLEKHLKQKIEMVSTHPMPAPTLAHHQHLEFSGGYIVSSVEERGIAATARGVECRFPLLDVRLLEYTLAVPAHLKLLNGITRNLIRSGMVGLLPDSIRCRDDKFGAAIPHGVFRLDNCFEQMYALLQQASMSDDLDKYLDLKQALSTLERARGGEKVPNNVIRNQIQNAVMATYLLGSRFGLGPKTGKPEAKKVRSISES